jgi:hypothetical protein
MSEDEALERWGDIQDDPDAIVECGERWKRVASAIGCELSGFNDGRSASFFTPDGNVIEVGPKFRAAITALHAREPLPVKDEDAEWLRDVIATYVFADQRDRLEAIAARLEEKRHG